MEIDNSNNEIKDLKEKFKNYLCFSIIMIVVAIVLFALALGFFIDNIDYADIACFLVGIILFVIGLIFILIYSFKPEFFENFETEEEEEQIEMKQCIFCGNELDEDSKFCSKCGRSTSEKLICPHCNFEGNKVDAIYCKNCGNLIKTKEVEIKKEENPKIENVNFSQPQTLQNSNETIKNLNLVLIGISFGLFIVSILASIFIILFGIVIAGIGFFISLCTIYVAWKKDNKTETALSLIVFLLTLIYLLVLISMIIII